MKSMRRNHGAAFKAPVAVATLKGDNILAEWVEHVGVHPTQITDWKQHLLPRVSDVFGGTTPKPDEPDLKSLHAKIGQLTLEHDRLEGALTKTGGLGARRLSTSPTHCRRSMRSIVRYQRLIWC